MVTSFYSFLNQACSGPYRTVQTVANLFWEIDSNIWEPNFFYWYEVMYGSFLFSFFFCVFMDQDEFDSFNLFFVLN